MQNSFRRGAFLIVILLTVMAAGCSRTAPARFYMLSGLAGTEAKAPLTGSRPCITLGIGPVEMPDYLDRPQIVTQINPNELHLGDFNQWAEPLGKTFMRTLADNLASLLCVDEIVFYPSEESDVDRQIVVTVTRFHGLSDGTVALTAQWQVKEGPGGKVVARQRSDIRESVAGQGYDALVAAQSKALARLSREIADAVTNIPK
jgi:uncharacterized protein